MSWSVILIRTKNNNEKFDLIEDKNIIGFTKSEVTETIIKISKETNTIAEDINTKFVHLRGDKWSIEFCFWYDEPFDTIELQIRGLEEPKEVFVLLQKYLNARLFDMHSGKFINEQIKSGFDEWKKFCDKIAESLNSD